MAVETLDPRPSLVYIDRMPKRRPDNVVAEIQRLYFEELLTVDQIGARLGGSRKTILRYVHEAGRPVRKPGWPEGRRQLARLGKSLPSLAPTEHPTLLDIAWAAGIYEGEGCVTRHKYGGGVRVGQKEPWILHRLRALFGGHIGGQFQHHTNAWSAGSRVNTWDLSGPRARGFLMTIYPFLSPHRRAQIRAAFLMSGVIKAA